MELSVVIPAYNEAQRLPSSLKRIITYLTGRGSEWEIIVVDDGSTDGTADSVPGHPRVRVVKHPINQGKGAAVVTGMSVAKGDWILLSDADLSTPIDELEKLWAVRATGDVIIGSRRVPGAYIQKPQVWWKDWLGRIGNLIIQASLLPGIPDTRCGFKLFSKKATELFKRSTLRGWGYDDEILFLARLEKRRIVQVPIRWIDDKRTTVPPSAYFRTLSEIIKIRFNHLRGLYKKP